MTFMDVWHSMVGQPPKSTKEYAQEVAQAYEALSLPQQSLLMTEHRELVVALELMGAHLRRMEGTR